LLALLSLYYDVQSERGELFKMQLFEPCFLEKVKLEKLEA